MNLLDPPTPSHLHPLSHNTRYTLLSELISLNTSGRSLFGQNLHQCHHLSHALSSNIDYPPPPRGRGRRRKSNAHRRITSYMEALHAMGQAILLLLGHHRNAGWASTRPPLPSKQIARTWPERACLSLPVFTSPVMAFYRGGHVCRSV